MSELARRCAVSVCSGLVLFALLSVLFSQPNVASAQEGAAAGAKAEEPAAPQQSTLMWLIHTSGWIGAVLLAMSFYFVAQVVRLFQDLRPEVVMPPELVDDMDKLLAGRDYPGILRVAKESQCELGQLVTSGITSLSSGLAEARESVDRMGEVITVELEKRISMLAVIGSLGPLIGLLGTLKGMISSFSVIAKGESQMKASEVAGGISEALLITFEGVALSVPAIFLFAVFKNRVASLSLQAITMADEFLLRVHGSARAKPAGAPAAGPAAPQA